MAETYPNQYLHVLENRSGQEWIMPLTARASLSVERQVRRWIKQEHDGQLVLEPPFVTGTGKSCVDYYARIITDGRPPDTVICWDSVGFFLRCLH